MFDVTVEALNAVGLLLPLFSYGVDERPKTERAQARFPCLLNIIAERLQYLLCVGIQPFHLCHLCCDTLSLCARFVMQ